MGSRSSNENFKFKPVSFIWKGHVTRMEESRSSLNILIGKPTGKIS